MTANCVGHGEVEVVELGGPTGLSKVKLPGGAEITVPTSYLLNISEPEKPTTPPRKSK